MKSIGRLTSSLKGVGVEVFTKEREVYYMDMKVKCRYWLKFTWKSVASKSSKSVYLLFIFSGFVLQFAETRDFTPVEISVGCFRVLL